MIAAFCIAFHQKVLTFPLSKAVHEDERISGTYTSSEDTPKSELLPGRHPLEINQTIPNLSTLPYISLPSYLSMGAVCSCAMLKYNYERETQGRKGRGGLWLAQDNEIGRNERSGRKSFSQVFVLASKDIVFLRMTVPRLQQYLLGIF